MYKAFVFILLSILLISFKTDKPAYYIFDNSGDKVKFAEMVDKLKDADIILFGELHDNPIVHWLQFELTKSMYDIKKENLILSAEMFESDNQMILNEYLDSIITEKKFESEARLWPNYRTDYKPLVNFAKDNKLKFIAANIPRRYASVVNSEGFEGLEKLSDEAKNLLPPFPIKYDPELNCYKSMMDASMMPMEHVNENFPKSQAVKDATMSHFILKNYEKGKMIIHYNGAYHSDNYESIYWYLKKALPNLKIKTISCAEQPDIDSIKDEYKKKADYIIVVPETMTKTR